MQQQWIKYLHLAVTQVLKQDNACAETFFHSLKVEAIHGEQLLNREQTKSRVFEYIAVDYNNQRRHSYTGYLSPADFEKQQKFA